VRRIEAITGPVAVGLMREHDHALAQAAQTLRVPPERVPGVVGELRDRIRELERSARRESSGGGAALEELVRAAVSLDGARVLAAAVPDLDGEALLALIDALKPKLGESAIVLGSSTGGKVDLVVAVSPSLVARGVKAGEIVKVAAAAVGGGGGGRDTLARAGGREPEKLGDAIDAARAAIAAALG